MTWLKRKDFKAPQKNFFTLCKVLITWFHIPYLEIFNDTDEGTLFRAYEKWCDELSTGSLQWDLSRCLRIGEPLSFNHLDTCIILWQLLFPFYFVYIMGI